MTATKDVMAALDRKGEVLCKDHSKDGPTYWLHLARIIVRRDIAEKIIQLPGIEPGKDGLLADAPQTWRLIKSKKDGAS